MKTVLEGEVKNVLPAGDGMIIMYCGETTETQKHYLYKSVSFSTGKVIVVISDIYHSAKFGPNYKAFKMQADNFLTCNSLLLPNGKVFLSEQDGTAKLLDTDASLIWQGTLEYNSFSPSSVALHENKLWVTYRDANIVIRYNLNTMREEMRLGGGEHSFFNKPENIFIDGDDAYISNAGSMQIIKMNLVNYDTSVYKEFTQEVKQYIKIKNYEFAVLESGVYMLD